ncbi:exopolysaccharide biosynthesis protein [Sulfitobacter sp. JB4-11]|uniref:exopolysaccharide biosynthesis protein n=1 Tax=Sulfitobacter rhodophyticola TaxID=3238304 RepID=UPI0035112D5D
MHTGEENTLSGLLNDVSQAARNEDVSVQDVRSKLGDRAITPFILLLAVLLVSPLSGIPGMPTVSAFLIVTMAVQALSGRRRLWLPRFLLRRKIAGKKLRRALDWLERPCAFLDKHSQQRLEFLTRGIMRVVTLFICVFIPLGWPFLEVLPFVTSVGAGTIALMVYGLFTRDGVYVFLGYLMVGLTVGGAILLWT